MSEQQWTPRIRRIDTNERERLQYVRSLIQEKRTDEARDELVGMLEVDDKSVRVHLMLGSLYQDQGLLGEAMEHFKYAIQLDPMDAQAHVRAGTCSLRMNETSQALTLLKTALDLDPKLVGGRVAYAQALSRLGETDDAIAEVEHALRLDPQMAPARLLMAQLLSQSGRAKEAIAELNGFIDANPDNARAATRLAMLQSRQGESEKAIGLLENATKNNPDDANIWLRLGRMKMGVHDYAGAEVAFREVVRLDQQDRRAPLRLVSTLIPQGKLDEAREMLKAIPRQGRLAGLVHQYYGDIYVYQKTYEAAVQSYRAALMHSESGDKMLAEIEPKLSALKDPQQVAELLKAELVKLREEVMSRMAEQRQSGGPGGGRMRRARPGQGQPLRLVTR